MSNKIDIEKVTKLYIEDKLPIRHIAEKLGYGYGTLYKAIKDAGLTREKINNTKSPRILALKEKIKDLYVNKKMSSEEIAKEVDICSRTVIFHLHEMGVKLRPVKKIDHDTFEKLWNEGRTDKEIADYFDVSVFTIKSYRTKGEYAGKYNVKRYFSQEHHKLSEIQEQMVLGSLLGDMSLFNPNRSKNSRITIVHCSSQKSLFMKKVTILDEFMGSYKEKTYKPDPRTGKCYSGCRGYSKAHKVFTDIQNILYVNGVKTITQEYLNKIHHPIALAYWFMDDGTYNGVIATNCFSLQEVQLLQSWMIDKWQIDCSIQRNHKNQYTLYIKTASRLQFESLIFPYIIPSMYYKLKHVDILKSKSV
jgi:cox1/2 intron 3 orf|uniref:LAGLIDADG DNA endonuclease family n=1 Tax=Podoviridae sp. ctz6O13 TaxID=2827757 RepID=A0A8S5TK09_9CAUD|nr:MAG TPA: LAGLIDADG DNA endonuclease family [Podoviridae sp. ctz6O13]